jgi:hypothetical protein
MVLQQHAKACGERQAGRPGSVDCLKSLDVLSARWATSQKLTGAVLLHVRHCINSENQA